jgi:hypothetical protein
VVKGRDKWIAALFLPSGAALLVYILGGVSLRWASLALVLGAAVVLALALRRMTPERRRWAGRRMAIGAVSGFAATVAYDVVRLALVELAGLELRPFEAWRLFGISLAGEGLSSTTVMIVGTAFHLCNGIAFGIAYTVAFGHRGPWTGILWAFVLEGLMVSVYPGWLQLKALDEFLSVSVLGHVAYGTTLGIVARSLLRSSRWGEHDHNPDSVAVSDTPGKNH